MIAAIILGLGLVLCIEGLAFALLPSRLDDLLATLARLPLESRRAIGLIALALGVGLVWFARSLGV